MASEQDLADLVGWAGDGVGDIDWEYIESELGVILPAGYRALVEKFPHGNFNGALEILQPRSATASGVERYLDAVFDYGELLAEAATHMSVRPPEVFPSVPGWFPWADIMGEFVVCSYLTGLRDESPATYVGRVPYGAWAELDGPIVDSLISMITGRIREVSGFLATSEPPSFKVYVPPPDRSPERETLPEGRRFWIPRDESDDLLRTLSEPVDAVDNLVELGLNAGPGQVVDWPAIEQLVGMPFPADYKRFIEEIGPGRYRDITVASPTGPTADAPGIFDVLSDLRERLLASYTNPPPVLPDPGAPLIWGEAPQGYFCGWQLDNFSGEPDLQTAALYKASGGIVVLRESMTRYIYRYLSEEESFSTTPWSGGPGSARRRWKQRGSLS